MNDSDRLTGWRLFTLWFGFVFFRFLLKLFAFGVLFYAFIHQEEIYFFLVKAHTWWTTGVWPVFPLR